MPRPGVYVDSIRQVAGTIPIRFNEEVRVGLRKGHLFFLFERINWKFIIIIIIYLDTQGGVEVLMVSSRVYPDQWILPKGGWEDYETIEEAAARESSMADFRK